MSERKTRAQLEEELDALRAVLAAFGEGMPPLPEDAEKMHLYNLECASRLSQATVTAAGVAVVADRQETWLALYAQQETAALRRRWARPLHYQPDPPDEKPPGFDCNCGRRLPWPARVQDETCPSCGQVWEYSGDHGGGARLKRDAAAIVAKASGAGLCHYCDIEPATAGDYCEACAAAVQMATAARLAAGAPAITAAAAAAPSGHTAFGPYCTATTVRGTVTYYCDQAPHSEGDHRSPGLCEDDPDVTWADAAGAPEPTLHERRLQAVRERQPAVQDGPYAYLRGDQ